MAHQDYNFNSLKRTSIGRRGLDRRQAQLRRLRLHALVDVALRSGVVCGPCVASGRGVYMLWCVLGPSHAPLLVLTARARAQRSTRRARPTCPDRRGSATCWAPSRAWSRSFCATATSPRCARLSRSSCVSATVRGRSRATTRPWWRSRGQRHRLRRALRWATSFRSLRATGRSVR